MSDVRPDRRIAARRRGNRLGFWFFRTALRLFGLRGAYGLLYIVCSYYLFFDRAGVRAALSYVRRRFPDHAFLRRLDDVYRLFVNQGKSLIDRYAILSGHTTFHVDFMGRGPIDPLLRDPTRGFVLLMSHVGNWQVILTSLGHLNRTVHLLMRPEDNRAVQESLGIDRETQGIRIISPEQALGGVPEMMKRLAQGDVVSIMGDRGYGFPTVEVSFLGAPARFPYGAFAVAAGAQCPVVTLLSAKTDTRSYRIDVGAVYHPRYRSGAKKREQLRAWVEDYARTIERHLDRYPYQSFLFHDVWADRPAEIALEKPAANADDASQENTE